jgi:CRISPR/Cas system-associated exonuclease Cas4 (RecB family)
MTYNKPISYSSKKVYAQCPKRWYHQYILGEREPAGKAAERGTRIHEALENFFLGGQYPAIPNEPMLQSWEPLMHELKDKGAVPEAELAVTVDWEPTKFGAKDAYFRGKADLILQDEDTLVILDFKTGRIYPEHEAQGASYIAMHRPSCKMTTGFIYLDHHPIVQEYEYSESDRDLIIEELKREIEVIRTDTEYVARGGDHCRWCPHAWRNKGDCKVAP